MILSPNKMLPRIFFLSGLSSLFYQVAWQRLLTLHYGVGAVATTLIVSVYMLGLGLGGLLGGHLADRLKKRLVLTYLIVESCLAIFGLASLPYLQLLGKTTAGAPASFSLFCIIAFLLLPTLLMGMTLPLVVKIFKRSGHDFYQSVSYLYTINTLGATAGCLLGSFLVISLFGLDTTVYVASTINFLLVLLIAITKFPASASLAAKDESNEKPGAALPGSSVQSIGKAAFALVFITGFLAIGYEILWFRMLQVLLKSSPYSFASILATYLFGISTGSYGICLLVEKHKSINKLGVFFLLQVLAALYISGSLAVFFLLLKTPAGAGFIGGLFTMKSTNWWDIFLYPFVFLFIPTIFMGASFPLMSSLALKDESSEGRAVGLTYFFNTAGNVFGGICTGFFLLPALGTELSLILFLLSGFAMILPVSRLSDSICLSLKKRSLIFLAMTLVCFFLPGRMQLYDGIHSTVLPHDSRQLWSKYFEEGVDGVVMAYQHQNVLLNFINGYGHGKRPDYKYYRESLEALSYADSCEKVMLVGIGAGSILESVLKIQDVKEVVIVEINGSLISNLKKMQLYKDMLGDKRVELIIDDARRYLQSTGNKYDMVLIDPLRSTEAYSNNIYSKEFFQLVSEHLRHSGLVLVWLDEFHSLPKTVATVFPALRLYNYFLLASTDKLVEKQERREKVLSSFAPQERASILAYHTEYRGNRSYVENESRYFPINEDWKPVCEYYIRLLMVHGLGATVQEGQDNNVRH